MSGEVLFVQFTVSCNTIFFYFTTATTEIYTLSLHDALPILWGARYITPNGKRRVFGSWHHGTMANALPQAMGAAFAYPDRQVISLSGDGGLGMLMGELLTIKQIGRAHV